MIPLLDPAHRTRFIVIHQGVLLLNAPAVTQRPWVTPLILLAPLALVRRTQGRERNTILLSVGIGVVLSVLCAVLSIFALAVGLASGRV